MTRTMLIPSTALMLCLLLSLIVHATEPDHQAGAQVNMRQAEAELELQELELKLAELGIDEAAIEFEKIKLHIEATEEKGDLSEVEHLRLALKQAAIRVEMRRVQAAMIRLHVARAKSVLEDRAAARSGSPAKPGQVRLEYVDESDVIVLRGEKGDVEKTMARMDGQTDRLERARPSLEVKIFSVVNGNARDLETELRTLYPADSAGTVYFASDPRTNSVIVRGTQAEVDVVEAMLLRLDSD